MGSSVITSSSPSLSHRRSRMGDFLKVLVKSSVYTLATENNLFYAFSHIQINALIPKGYDKFSDTNRSQNFFFLVSKINEIYTLFQSFINKLHSKVAMLPFGQNRQFPSARRPKASKSHLSPAGTSLLNMLAL